VSDPFSAAAAGAQAEPRPPQGPQDTAGSAIRASGLVKWFGEADARTYAVKEVSFEASLGEMLYLVGPSGSGKTTLLSIISGILRPNQGQVEVKGSDIWNLGSDRLADFRLHTVGFVFQDYHLFPRLTTAENVAVPLVLRKWDWTAAMAEAQKYLEIVGLADRAALPPVKLSGGEQQRVAIARAIIGQPDILIFDEPTASLAGETGRRILSFVRSEILTGHRCILIVTHDSRIYEFADRIMRMEDGRITGIDRVSP
jgi:putative ABC transport system ATP-binding protein